MNTLAVRAADYAAMTGHARDQFIREMGFAASSRFVTGYFMALDASHGKVRFVRATRQFPPRSLLRFDMGNGATTYVEFLVATDSSGRTRTIDWWQSASGELQSVSMGGLARLARTANPVQQLLRMEPKDPAADVMDKVYEFQRKGDFPKALDAIKQLPEPAASAPAILAMRASIASYANRLDEYNSTFEKIERLHAFNPAAPYVLLDYYLLNEAWAKALSAVEALEKRVGQDGPTRLLYASIQLRAGDVAAALRSIDESIALEPDRPDSREFRARLLIQSGRFAEAVAAYRDIETRFGTRYERGDFAADPANASFVKSAAFRDWTDD